MPCLLFIVLDDADPNLLALGENLDTGAVVDNYIYYVGGNPFVGS
jgi:hypothetical protein